VPAAVSHRTPLDRACPGGERIYLCPWPLEIAEAGLAVTTSEFTAGEMVSLELSFPEVPDVQRLRAVVRHRMGFLHGFEFIGLLPDQRELIRKYCRTLRPT
jgi:hypothetical protein